MTPREFLPFYAAFLVIATAERTVSTFFSGRPPLPLPALKTSSRRIFRILFISYLVIVALSITEFFVKLPRINPGLSLAGFLIFLGGVYLRRKAMKDLGANWSMGTEIKAGHELVTSGIYRWVKHPYYCAVVLELLGVCLIAHSFVSLIPVFAVQGPLLAIRIKDEEELLAGHFGGEYRAYSKARKI
jgi:protein-S-isoprenylcysteine O-methyltransferase Ste14